MSQHRPTMVSGSCKRDAVWNSSAVLARKDEVGIFGAGQAITKVIGSSEEGNVDSVLTSLRLDIVFSFQREVAWLHSLSTMEIEGFASRDGVHKEDVEVFLDTVGEAGNEGGALLNLYYDARLYNWNISTVQAIEAGIQSAYANEAVNAGAIFNGVNTPLLGAPYSLWPRRF
jgi:hypothetical protein